MTTVPELILLDINLPKLSGLDVLRAIRGDERTRYLAVVVLTTSNEEQDIINSYDLGANSYAAEAAPPDIASGAALDRAPGADRALRSRGGRRVRLRGAHRADRGRGRHQGPADLSGRLDPPRRVQGRLDISSAHAVTLTMVRGRKDDVCARIA